MKHLLLGLGAAAMVLLFPAAASAQVPVLLVCQDGSTQPGPTRTACDNHGKVDWHATKAWSEMRAGHFAPADTVVCMDGQAAAASRTACSSNGGVDSVSTVAAIRRRAKAERFASPDTGAAAADTTHGYKAGASEADTSGHQRNQSGNTADTSSTGKSSSGTTSASDSSGTP
ncbi:MAG TPA: hypothetical protein VF046_10515 [Gemmatimonadales bacterium]